MTQQDEMTVWLSNKSQDEKVPVVAIAMFGGLAVTPTWWSYDFEIEPSYAVTHVVSGSDIWHGMPAQSAIRLMGALCERLNVDWTMSFEAFEERRKRDPMLYVRVRNLIREITGE